MVYEDGAAVEIIQILLDYGADITERTTGGETILHLSVYRTARLQLILEHRGEKLDVNALDHNRRTPLHYAAAAGFDGAMQLLLEHGAGIDIKDKHQATTLHFGVNWTACTAFTIEHTNEVNAQDNFGRTALHYAALVEDPERKVRGLLETAGVRTGTVDLQRKTAQCYEKEDYGTDENDEVTGWVDGMRFRCLELHKAVYRAAFDSVEYYSLRYGQHFEKRIKALYERSKTWTIVSDSEEEDYEPERL